MRLSRCVGLAAAFVALAAPAAAQAAQNSFTVENVRTQAQRAAVARTGAAIVAVDHGHVTVTASRSDLPQAPARRVQGALARPAPPTSRPPTRRTTTTRRWRRRRRPSRPPTRRIVPPLQHRHLVRGPRACWAVKISDNVGTDENEPEVLFTANQHAREHLTVEMALYLLNQLTAKYGDRHADHEPRQLRARSGSSRRQPGRRRVRHRHRLLPLVAQEPPAQHRLERGRHRPQPQLGLPVGLLRRLVAARSRRRPTAAPSAFSAPETAARARLRQQSRVVGGVQQIKAHIDFHTYSELVLWPYGYTTANTAPGADRRRPARRSPRSASRWPPPTATRPSRPATSTSPTARSTTGCGATHKIFPTRSRCTRGRRARASTRPTR